MEITTQERVKDLKPYEFNQDLFDLLKGSDYEALKRDIKQNGVKVELHILPDKTVICGHQRLRIAKELGISHLRCKTVSGLDMPEQVREYVILDNLLRRHLSREKRAILHYELYEMKKKPQPRGTDGQFLPTGEDIYQEIANQTNNKRRTVVDDVQYVKAVKANPNYKGKKISVVLRKERKRKDEERITNESNELKIKGKYKTIVFDPPWKLQANVAGRAEPDYAVMNLEEIDTFYKEKIEEHLDINAHFYLWTINTRLHDAFHLLEKWKLEYKTIITWVKPNIGLGNFFRNNTEHMLFCIKGKLTIRNEDLPTWFKAKKGKHSEKPDEAYELIKKASYPPYLDVLGRKKREDWDIYGTEQ